MSERVCLLCFSFGKVYKNIKHTQLQVVYETLSDIKVQADTFPLCYICYAKLLKCEKLIKTVQQHDIENQGIVIPLVQLATFGAESWSLPDKLQLHNIKEESNIKRELVEKASGSFKNEIDIEEGYPDSIVKNETTTTESSPSVPDVLSTTKEPTKKRRHEENWEKFKNTKQKNSGQVYTDNTKKKLDSKTKGACKCNKNAVNRFLKSLSRLFLMNFGNLVIARINGTISYDM
ncbi:uncharacterized protein LOC121737822 isoform X3 [Aricia agestis]|uniref:uncharacterized protein LOC121737822 isoform X3 n=1 Tax=Aricia agestis TaxID=91739 RepID=UPI001C204E08|nr:uncharacterized protein LOC121737822 isoform X3 [Aricia agestis]